MSGTKAKPEATPRLSPGARYVLTEARRRIAERWAQGRYRNARADGAAYDLVGAICGGDRERVARMSDHEVEALDTVYAALAHEDRQDFSSLVAWNDAPTRTQAQVLALIDRVLGIAAEANREPTR